MTEEQYNKLSEAEKEACDLCKDYNLGDCKSCEFMKRGSE